MTISTCSICGVPAHASETDDLDRCAACVDLVGNLKATMKAANDAELALGSILRMGARPSQPGDLAEYDRCRTIVIAAMDDALGPLGDQHEQELIDRENSNPRNFEEI